MVDWFWQILPYPALRGCIYAILGVGVCGFAAKSRQLKANKLKSVVALIGVVFFLALTIILESRAAVLAVVAGICAIIIKRVLHVKRVSKIVLMTTALSILLSILFFVRPESAEGRLLIWRICGNMIKEEPFWGFGPGGFSREYMNYQANYLSGIDDEHLLYLADDVFCPYNEYLHIAINFGLIPLIAILVVLAYVLWSGIKRDNLFAYQLLGFLVFSFFSFPSYHLSTCILFPLLLFASLSADRSLPGRAVRALSVIIAGWIICLFAIRSKAEKEILAGICDRSDNIAEIHSDIISKSPYLIDTYISICDRLARPVPEKILDLAVTNTPSCHVLSKAAEKEMAEGNNNTAEALLRRASAMVPSRLKPKKLLLQILVSESRLEEAVILGDEILRMPDKVTGSASILTREEIKHILYENNLSVSYNNP